jgi:hypothetical protein
MEVMNQRKTGRSARFTKVCITAFIDKFWECSGENTDAASIALLKDAGVCEESAKRMWKMLDPHKGKLETLGMTFMCGQVELCPTTQRIHLQMYLELGTQKSLDQIQEALGTKANCQARRGTQQQAIEYVTKDETRLNGEFSTFWYGTPSASQKQGQRTDILTQLTNVKTAVYDGASVTQLIDDHTVAIARFPKFVQMCEYAMIHKLAVEKQRVVKTFVLHGLSGAGKTSQVKHFWGPRGIFHLQVATKNATSTLWWNGYNPLIHKVILIDEFSGQLSLDALKVLLDPYPGIVHVEFKGSVNIALYEYVFITSNSDPSQWYSKCPFADVQALSRRLHTGGVYEVRHWRPGHPSPIDPLLVDAQPIVDEVIDGDAGRAVEIIKR